MSKGHKLRSEKPVCMELCGGHVRSFKQARGEAERG